MPESEELKDSVLTWLDTLRIPGSCCRYRFSANGDDTIFCSCFALFILDLFNETKKFTEQDRQNWISYIQSFQNEEHGCFEPETYYSKDKERNCYQLTCFCLSALKILDAEPKFSLKFTERWKTADDIKKYLYEKGCHKGRGGSGNSAMFLAKFLTYEYERTKESRLLNKINAWFKFHDETQNRNGFWGSGLKSHYISGLQNGFHQLVIYFYWQREVLRLNRIVDIVLMSQDREGFFATTPGGETCFDYDSIYVLATAYRITNYRKEDIKSSLTKAFDAILSTRSSDAGFRRSKYRLANLRDFLLHIPFYFSGRIPYLWYLRVRISVFTCLQGKDPVYSGWSKTGRRWDESNLFDTWFRCLALAELANTIDLRSNLGLNKASFHEMIGLGFFKKHRADSCSSDKRAGEVH
jgi:hypothetical protein